MRPFIGFSHYGHLGQHYMAAAKTKGFKVSGKIEDCDIVFVSPDRPGEVSPEQAVESVLYKLKKDAVLVILCQVKPGFTRKVKWPKEQLYYQVETLRMKDAKERALHPDRIIIGEHWQEDEDNPEQLHKKLMEFLTTFDCLGIVVSYEEAELAKIAINVYLAAQVCVTDTLANVAKKIGAEWKNVIPALTSDNRIGEYAYLQPGGYCGGHLERDLKQLIKYSSVDTSVIQALLEYSGTSQNNPKQSTV